jgi:predicted Zn-dependent protease
VGRSREAGDLLASLVAQHPDDERVLFTQGRVMLALGQMPEALEVFERLGRLHPESPYGLDGAGTVLIVLKRDAEAETAFRGALGLDPYDTNALFNLGLLKLNDGEGARDAAHLLERYLRLMPSDARGWTHLARARESLGDALGAREARERAERTGRRR